MVVGVQDVYVNVSEMEPALVFYRDVLGLTVTDETPHFVGLSAGGVRIGLHWTGGSPVPEIAHDAHGAHAGATITFRVANLEETLASVEVAGATILGQSENPWGNILVMQDPDGNVLKLMALPG